MLVHRTRRRQPTQQLHDEMLYATDADDGEDALVHAR